MPAAEVIPAPPSFLHALLAGGVAGFTVDVALYPIDTLKTRLQSPQGFAKAGGTRGVYAGIGAVSVGSAPGAALFFVTYEGLKPAVSNALGGGPDSETRSHMASACLAQAAGCLFRVPTEVVKSRMQTRASGDGALAVARAVAAGPEGAAELYRGLGATLLREVPFALVQFPLYERLKMEWGRVRGTKVTTLQGAACGSMAGCVAGSLMTPLDVVKTRMMLGADAAGVSYKGAGDVIVRVFREEGAAVLYSGVGPRTVWIGLGGFVFFGAYEGAKDTLQSASTIF
mmetsp:Transcript_26507/g.52798  ORF Transcript_26507/g.52798 Transcript_26507/m.52798 type:complete len:285 (+) Transcript_26507:73-927(+)